MPSYNPRRPSSLNMVKRASYQEVYRSLMPAF